MLKEQDNPLSNAEYLNRNPFEITESDTEEANTNNNLKDHSDSEDDLKNIEQRKLPIVKIIFLLNKRLIIRRGKLY